ncbi:MAG: NAD(P)-dependent oxidoreductase [Chloroflexi bacterium]|nr:NAD(P)-dependent oxidoreductase [Chloroflexota bacterium]
MADKKRVLVTGMAGQIGGIIRRFLGDKYELSGVDVRPAEGAKSLVADLADFDAVRPAFEGMDTVVHLGGDPSPRGSWESMLKNNIIGTRNVLEASVEAGVKRVIFASTNHVIGFYPLKQDPYKAIYEGRLGEVRRPFLMLTDKDLRPDSLYGVSKAFGESIGSYYQDEYGLSFIAMRIGWVMTPDDPTFSPPSLSLWLSHRDCAQFVERCIDAPPSVGFAIVYAMSRNSLRIWDIESSKRIIGFDPQDGAGEEWKSPPGGPRSFM